MGSHAHEFRGKAATSQFTSQKQHHALRRKDHALLHEPVETAAAEPAGPQVVLSDKFILLGGGVGEHNDDVARLKDTRAVADHAANALVNERMGSFFASTSLLRVPW